LPPEVADSLRRGVVIPAHPLALTAERRLGERRQRALSRYYAAAGAGGLALAVHTTQFAIHDPQVGLLRPVLELAKEEMDRADEARAQAGRGDPLIRIGGVVGATARATREAVLLRELGYHVGLVSLAALRDAPLETLLDHCRAVAEILPVMGFYLQPLVGGRVLPYAFWRRFAEIPGVVAIKIAPFNRYQTIDVVRAVVESQRDDVALYTGNDDNIVADLLTPYRFKARGWEFERRLVGGLLGQWAVWTRRAVELLDRRHRVVREDRGVPLEMMRLNVEMTDANGAIFDVANGFKGCVVGVHEILRRQGLLEGVWLLDPDEGLSPGQSEEIDRVIDAYPHLNDNAFVAEHREEWLRG